MQFHVTHKTVYRYDHPVSVSHHLLRLTPRELLFQRTLEHDLTATPKPAVCCPHPDHFGNLVTFITVEEPHLEFSVTSRLVVELAVPPPPDPGKTPPWESLRDPWLGTLAAPPSEAAEFAFPSPLVPRRPEFAAYAAESFPQGRPALEANIHLMGRIHQDFKFDPKATTVATALDQVFRQRRGVCQDFAHLQIACLRSLGLPARYVSGYLETLPPPGKPKLAGADASHAWLQVWCGDVGWIGLDPTNNLLPADRHLTIAYGRDYEDVSPVRGVVVGSGRHQLSVAVDVVSDA